MNNPYQYNQNKPHWIHYIGAITGILALCFAVFIWFVPGPNLPISQATNLHPVPIMTPTPTIPHLKQLYNGTSNCLKNCPGANTVGMQLAINSQDPQGHFNATASYDDGGPFSWVGTVTANGSITVQMSGPGIKTGTFQGTIYPNGHIDGTETFPNTTESYHDILS